MAGMGMEVMVGGDMEVEEEAEVVDLEVVVAQDSEDDGDGFSGNLAYLLALWAESRTICTMNGQNEINKDFAVNFLLE